ncbi:hypothetical protein [Chelativorans sp. M5D2P16]|uniref:hypothetical protein n=1 Tax=Chelativorans sp. M5D2P16 TaxID=3095678 RepID=UPI002ACA46D7|nr:hypothetical protein [Chelativorans sp. M5D2P16]MDZ5697826.1 hypothetical protein [Chelativorans sp. M5D2P16]
MSDQPYDSMLPIIRQMHEARTDEERARLLLMVSDALLMKCPVFEAVCRKAGFGPGLEYINVRRAAFHAIRGPDGRHKNPLFEDARSRFAEIAGMEGGAL